MSTPSINIGLCSIGKNLSRNIDEHFRLHESKLYDAILSSSVTLENGKYDFGHLDKEGENVESDTDYVKSWFEHIIYPKINNLRRTSIGGVDHLTIVNIILQIEDPQAVDILKELLNSVQELKEEELIGTLSIRLFVVINPSNQKKRNSNEKISENLLILKQVIDDFNDLLYDIYYIDNQNTHNISLNLNQKWLGFALGEFFVLQMVGPTSMAQTHKNKIFGLGVVHFNEVLFRDLISNQILAYKFEEEGIDDYTGVQQQDIFDKCNPFIKNHQDFFKKYFERYPYSNENDQVIENNTKKYILDFKSNLDEFVTNDQHKIGESKAILANLIGEDDEKLEGVDWKGERLNLKDLEFDIVNYFNEYVEEKDKVDLKKEKELRERITDLNNGIKKDNRILKNIKKNSDDIHSDLNISFEEGVFSIDGKRINASGYIPSKIDPSEDFYTFKDEVIPDMMDLSHYFNSVKDQGQLGSCTAFPIAAVYEFAAIQNKKKVDVSELYIYYNSRVIRGNVNQDTGASLLDAVNSVKKHGACLSESYPYKIENFKSAPSESSFIEAKHQVVEKACRVQINEKNFKQAIANGHPVIFGLKLFESFYPKDNSGLIPYPSPKEASHKNHGHHAMLVVGYNDEEKLFKVRNSWGEIFGNQGYCYIPYDYATDSIFCTEAFVITEIIDLSYSEFEYDTNASFSFLKDTLIRKKNITEYRLRERVKELDKVKKEFNIVVVENDENTEQIKDSIFRKNILRRLETNIPELPSNDTPPVPEKPKNLKRWYYFLAVGVIAIILAFLLKYLITIIGTTILGILGLAVSAFAIWKLIQSNKYSKKNIPVPTPVNLNPNNRFGSKDIYFFRVADRIFDLFEEMDKDLINRYRALSKYFSKVKEWKEENNLSLDNVDFNSPTFVINVVEKKPLMDYLSNQKDFFLKKLPNLSALFHIKYDPRKNNVDEVFNELKEDYLKDIQQNTDEILNVSIVEYLLGKNYPYFNDSPSLEEIVPQLNRVSKPFCNLKSSYKNISTQHYVLMEKIESQETKKSQEFARHRDAHISPVIVERDNNRKKFVSIQVAALENIENLVRFVKSR
jgi:C1A family cysteine protease